MISRSRIAPSFISQCVTGSNITLANIITQLDYWIQWKTCNKISSVFQFKTEVLSIQKKVPWIKVLRQKWKTKTDSTQLTFLQENSSFRFFNLTFLPKLDLAHNDTIPHGNVDFVLSVLVFDFPPKNLIRGAEKWHQLLQPLDSKNKYLPLRFYGKSEKPKPTVHN